MCRRSNVLHVCDVPSFVVQLEKIYSSEWSNLRERARTCELTTKHFPALLFLTAAWTDEPVHVDVGQRLLKLLFL